MTGIVFQSVDEDGGRSAGRARAGSRRVRERACESASAWIGWWRNTAVYRRIVEDPRARRVTWRVRRFSVSSRIPMTNRSPAADTGACPWPGARRAAVCASRGKKGIRTTRHSSPAAIWAPSRDELRRAALVLGVAEVVIYDHPDGNLRWTDEAILLEEIVSAIRTYRPDAVITFGADGLYWHVDHIAIHERTKNAVRTFGHAAPSLYYVTITKGAMRALVDYATAKGWAPPDSGFWSLVPDAFGLLARQPSFIVDVRTWVPRKLAALQCHRTQMGADNPFAQIVGADGRRPTRRRLAQGRPAILARHHPPRGEGPAHDLGPADPRRLAGGVLAVDQAAEIARSHSRRAVIAVFAKRKTGTPYALDPFISLVMARLVRATYEHGPSMGVHGSPGQARR